MIRKVLSARVGALAVVFYTAALPAIAPQAAAAPDTEPPIVSLADIQQLTDRADLVAEPVYDAPAPDSGDPHAPGACQAVYGQEQTFGTGWKRFRTAAYSADTGVVETMAVVMQAVGLYPDAKTARTAFDRLVPALEACSELRSNFYDFTVTTPDPSTIVLAYRGYHRSVVYRVKSAALINVVAGGFPDPEQVADVVVRRIADRVK